MVRRHHRDDQPPTVAVLSGHVVRERLPRAEGRWRYAVEVAAAGVLPGFAGVAVHDGWAPYWYFEDATHALCGAHLLRELEAIADEPGQC